MDRLAVWGVHDPPLGKAERLLIKGGCRFHVGHREDGRYRTVALFIERIDFFGHKTPFGRRVFELNFGASFSGCAARRNLCAAERKNTSMINVRSTCEPMAQHTSPSVSDPAVLESSVFRLGSAVENSVHPRSCRWFRS